MKRWSIPALVLVLAGSAAGDVLAAGDCGTDESCWERDTMATNLCRPVAGGAAAWADDPFDPSIPGVRFHEKFDLRKLVERLGPPTSRTTWREVRPDRDPTTGPEYDTVIFFRFVFPGVAVETAHLFGAEPEVVLLDITAPRVRLKCGVKLGMHLLEITRILGLPDRAHKPPPTVPNCPAFYDLYDIPFQRSADFKWGDNSTICFYPDLAGQVTRILWDKRRWTTGYH